MARITTARLEELKRRAQERAPNLKAWQYLEIEEDKPLSAEQREMLNHNNAIDSAVCGFRYIETREQVKYDEHIDP
jgi:hypothetical protein